MEKAATPKLTSSRPSVATVAGAMGAMGVPGLPGVPGVPGVLGATETPAVDAAAGGAQSQANAISMLTAIPMPKVGEG